MSQSWKTHYYTFTVREEHIDSYGHVNNATYLQLFEEARWVMIEANGYGFKRIHELKIGPIILEIHIKFIKEILLGQIIQVESQMTSYSGKVGEMLQQMKSEEGVVLCSAAMKFGLFDLQKRKLIEPTWEWLKAIGDLNTRA